MDIGPIQREVEMLMTAELVRPSEAGVAAGAPRPARLSIELQRRMHGPALQGVRGSTAHDDDR